MFAKTICSSTLPAVHHKPGRKCPQCFITKHVLSLCSPARSLEVLPLPRAGNDVFQLPLSRNILTRLRTQVPRSAAVHGAANAFTLAFNAEICWRRLHSEVIARCGRGQYDRNEALTRGTQHQERDRFFRIGPLMCCTTRQCVVAIVLTATTPGYLFYSEEPKTRLVNFRPRSF
jgi:hypothetical protein